MESFHASFDITPIFTEKVLGLFGEKTRKTNLEPGKIPQVFKKTQFHLTFLLFHVSFWGVCMEF